MGGLGSGRKRRHTSTDDCLEIDTTWLRKQQVFAQDERAMSIVWERWRETDFVKRTKQHYKISALYRADTQVLALSYQTECSYTDSKRTQKKNHMHALSLESTPCNYGNVRWWFLCPRCARRVRKVYISLKASLSNMEPLCRHCLGLHYASQMATYIERHQTYERYLLANYGLFWASDRYEHGLKQHYLEMTPDLWALRLKSVTDWNMHLLKEVIKFDLLIYRTDLANYKSLRSEEDRRVYLKHMEQQKAELNTAQFVRILFQCIEYERLLYEINTRAMPDDLFDIYSRLADLHQERDVQVEAQVASYEQINEEADLEQKIISLETMLHQVTKRDRQKAA